MQIMQNEIC